MINISSTRLSTESKKRLKSTHLLKIPGFEHPKGVIITKFLGDNQAENTQ
jgi:hypothetical protein